ncbi:MAG: energy transducer TonB [Acidobacteriota bacterium]
MNCNPSPGKLYSFNRLLLVFAFFASFSVVAQAQVPAAPTKSKPADAAKTPPDTAKPAEANTTPTTPAQSEHEPIKSTVDPANSPEAFQSRIERARALIAAHRLDTAASELEAVRATARDSALKNITSIMLMNVYLEEGNYGRAEALLEENFRARAAQKDESLGIYFALAGQAVNGARAHLARYRTFGVNTSSAGLPAEALSDLDRLRSLLERMIVQAKDISSGRMAYDSLSLLEDVLGLRLSLAKDSEDQTRWESEYASARVALASSQTQIASLGGVPPLRPGKTAGNGSTAPSPYSTKRVPESSTVVQTAHNDHVSAEPTARASETAGSMQATAKPDPGTGASQTSSSKSEQPDMDDAGSLLAFATRKVVPKYPPLAKQNGAAGLVRVYVTVEGGKVVAVSRTEGPMLLRGAAEEAARQWSFQNVSIEGRPTRLTGYIDFNFSL